MSLQENKHLSNNGNQCWNHQIIRHTKDKKDIPKSIKKNTKPKKLDITDNPKVKKIDGGTAKLIREKRLAMGYNSQKEFAKKINANIADVRNCETTNCVYNPQILNKIKRVLQINKHTSG